jgi:Capsule polysaccharide biosynthesis protein
VNILVWGFCGLGGGEIVKELRGRDIAIREWISDQDGSRNIWEFLLGNIPAVPKDADALIRYESFYRNYFQTYHVMIARRGLYFADLHEVTNEFSLAYHYFSRLLKQTAIDMVLFANMPHEGPDFILYNLAKRVGIKTLICYQTLFPDKFYTMTSIDDFGEFATTPGVSGGTEVPLDRGYYQQSVNMDGFIQPEIPEAAGAAVRAMEACRALLAGPVPMLKSPWRSLKNRVRRVLVNDSEPNLQNAYMRQMREHALNMEGVDSLILKHEKMVYFPLHLQPELTTSTFGGVFQDQLYAVELLSSALGEGWLILVKENPKQTYFQRRTLFFRRLSAMGNVRLVQSTYSTYKLMKRARFVATISGTACWEAIKGGKKCLIFGKAWFSRLPGVFTFTDDFDFPAFLESTRHELEFEELHDAFRGLMKRARTGVVDRDYACLVPGFELATNARKVADAILEAARSSETVWN